MVKIKNHLVIARKTQDLRGNLNSPSLAVFFVLIPLHCGVEIKVGGYLVGNRFRKKTKYPKSIKTPQ